MAEPFDPYVEWLGIRAANRPLNYYQLLSLDEFEDDPQRIVTAADRALARVRACRPGSQGKHWQRLLDELSLAKLCLTDPTRKHHHDAQLQARQSAGNAEWTSEAPRLNPDLLPPSRAPASPPVAAAPAAAPALASPPVATPVASPPVANATWPAAPPMANPAAMAPVGLAPSYPAAAPVAVVYPQATPVAPVARPIAAVPMAVPVVQPLSATPQAIATAVPVATAAAVPFGTAPAVAKVVSLAPSMPVIQGGVYAPLAGVAVPQAVVSAPQRIALAPVVAVTPAPVAKSTGTFEDATPAMGTFAPAAAASNAEQPFAFGTRYEAASTPSASLASANRSASHNQLYLALGMSSLAVLALGVVLWKAGGAPSDAESPIARASSIDHSPDRGDSGDTGSPLALAPQEAAETVASTDDEPKPASKPRPPKRPKTKPKPAEPQSVAAVDEPKSLPGNTSHSEPPAAPPANAEKSAACRQAVASAFAALGARDVPRAQRELVKAKPLAETPEDQTEVSRMNALVGYVEGFWKAVQEGMAGLQAADEIKVDDSIAAVVDSSREGMTLHIGGANREYSLKTLPSGLAMTLAQRWFDQSAANKLFLGAFLAVDPQGNKQEARRMWEAATAGGASATDLLPLLDRAMPAEGAAGDLAPPSEKQVAAALKRIKETYQAEFRAAKTPGSKVELSQQLVSQAASTEDPVIRYAMLREAIDQAAAGANAGAIFAAVDELGRAYKVEVLELKADALARAAGALNNALLARDIAQHALDLADEAIAAGRAKPAAKLSQAASTAAKKAKDPVLIKAANRSNQKAQELGK